MLRYLFVGLLVLSSAALLSQPRYIIMSTDADATLIPEGIAIDSKTQTIDVSSINHHKIIAVNKKGKTRDFIVPGQDGFLSGLGNRSPIFCAH